MSWRDFLARLSSQVWMVEPKRFDLVVAVLSRLHEGGAVSASEIEAAAGRPFAGMGFRSDYNAAGPAYQVIGSVAMIDVWGILDKTMADVSFRNYRWGTGYDAIRAGVRGARNDQAVKTIAMRFDSPGGDAVNVETAALDIFEAAGLKAEAGGKPIVAIADGYMASAALYLGAQANKLVTLPGSWIGSIGTIMHTVDYSQALANDGIKVETIKSHALKDAGSSYRAMTPEDRAHLQAQVDTYDAAFRSALARGRGVSMETVRAWQDTQAFIGRQAVDAGIADKLYASVEAVISDLNGGGSVGSGRSAAGAGAHTRAEAPPSEGGAGQPPATGAEATQAGDTPAGDEGKMPEETKTTAQGGPPAGAGPAAATIAAAGAGPAPLAEANAAAAATKSERARVSGIMARSAAYSGNAAVLKLRDEAIDGGLSPEQFADRVLTSLSASGGPTGHVPGAGEQRGTGAVSITEDGRDRQRRGVTSALLMRTCAGQVAKVRSGHEQAEPIARALGFATAADARKEFDAAGAAGFRGRSLAMLAAGSMVAAGVAPSFEAALGMFGDAPRFMAAAAHSSSDFPLILANVANKQLLAIFAEQPTIWERVCRRGVSTDYKERQLLSLSESPNVQVLEEGDTPKEATFNERKEGVTVKARGLRFSMTYQMMRNDDLGAFSNVLQLIGYAFKRAPDIALVTLLESNTGRGPTMSDGNLMFSASHANGTNIMTGAALAYETLRTGWTNFRNKKGFGPDAEFIELMPRVLVVPTALELTARDLVTQEMAPSVASGSPSTAATTQRNIFRGLLDVAATPRFSSSTRWWLFTEPGPFSAIEMAFLDGNELPQVDRIQDSDPLAIRWQATQLGFACAASGWEGAVVNDGV